VDFTANRHFKTRSVGRLYTGEGSGYDNRVMQLTVHELEFPSSMAAERFLDSQRKKYTNKNGLMRQRRMKLQSIGSD